MTVLHKLQVSTFSIVQMFLAEGCGKPHILLEDAGQRLHLDLTRYMRWGIAQTLLGIFADLLGMGKFAQGLQGRGWRSLESPRPQWARPALTAEHLCAQDENALTMLWKEAIACAIQHLPLHGVVPEALQYLQNQPQLCTMLRSP